MTPDLVLSLGRDAALLMLLIAGPILAVGLVVGLAVSVFQAVTQIHEMTLTFIPKILAVMGALLLSFPWMLETLVSFTTKLIKNIPLYTG